jgi:hypothetical protein
MVSLLGCLKRRGLENNTELEEKFERNQAFSISSADSVG